MALPAPEPGLVIQYNYLWKRQQAEGLDQAPYPRHAAIVLAVARADTGIEVVAVPFTTRPPREGQAAVAIPPRVLTHLGLDGPSWAMTDEVNTFVWPGFDLAPVEPGRFDHGLIPPALHARIRDAVLLAAAEGRLARTRR